MLSNAVKELQQRKNQLAAQIRSLEAESKKIGQAIKVLAGLSGGSVVAAPGKRKMSPAHRRALAKAQAARWAKHNAQKAGKAPVAKPAKKRKKMSAAARKRISEFQKARWAKIKAKKASKK